MRISYKNIKLIAYTALLMVTILSCKIKEPEEFEGIIKFKTQYFPHSEEVSVDQLITMYGDTSIVFMKDGNYKQVYPNADYIEAVQYENESNRYYTMIRHIDTLYYLDAGVKFFDHTIKPGPVADTIIMGYNCKSIVIASEVDTNTYFYAPKLPLNSERFRNHKLTGYDLLTQNTKAVFLVQYGGSTDYSYITTAFEITKKELDYSIFQLPDYFSKNAMN